MLNNNEYLPIEQEIRHKIYKRLIDLLLNQQIRNKQTKEILPYIFHDITKQESPCFDVSENEIEIVEAQIIDEIENNLLTFEIIRSLPMALYFDLKATGEVDLIHKIRAAPIPGSILNAFICEQITKEFEYADILACEGFILREGCLRLDVDEKLARRGFMIPVVNQGLISALKVFRYPKDEFPFILRSRKSNSLRRF